MSAWALASHFKVLCQSFLCYGQGTVCELSYTGQVLLKKLLKPWIKQYLVLAHFSFRAYHVCVFSNSSNDVPRVAQRYGTIAVDTRRRASVLVVFVLFSVHMHSFAGLIRQTPPPTFSDTAVTDRHSDTTFFQLRAHWVRISWSIGSEKSLPIISIYTLRYCLEVKVMNLAVWDKV